MNFFTEKFAYIIFFSYLCTEFQICMLMNEKEFKEKAAKELAEQVMRDCYAMCGIW